MTLLQEHRDRIHDIHTVMLAWIHARSRGQGEEKAEQDLRDFKVADEFASPSDAVHPYRVLLSGVTNLYWHASMLSIQGKEDAAVLTELSTRLAYIPSFGSPEHLLSSEEITSMVTASNEIRRFNPQVGEAIMRCAAYLLQDLANEGVVSKWRALMVVGEARWERDE